MFLDVVAIWRGGLDHYLQHRLFYDFAGWSGPDYAAERGVEWVRVGLAELPSSQVVFATDYPQAVRDDDEIVAYVKAVGGLRSEARKILDGANAEKLIPNLVCTLMQGSMLVVFRDLISDNVPPACNTKKSQNLSPVATLRWLIRTWGPHDAILHDAGGRIFVEQMADTGHKLAVTTSRDQDLGAFPQ